MPGQKDTFQFLWLPLKPAGAANLFHILSIRVENQQDMNVYIYNYNIFWTLDQNWKQDYQ